MIQSNKLTAKGKRMIANYEDNIIVSSYYNFIIKQKMKELCMVCLVGLKLGTYMYMSCIRKRLNIHRSPGAFHHHLLHLLATSIFFIELLCLGLIKG